MARHRFRLETIIHSLRKAEAGLAQRKVVPEEWRKLGVYAVAVAARERSRT